VWRFQPRAERPTCLKCDYDWTHTLSPTEAKASGVDVAAAMKDHTEQLKRSWLRRHVMFVGAMVRAMVDEWGKRLEKLAKEAHSL
jgi:hypothetical protein